MDTERTHGTMPLRECGSKGIASTGITHDQDGSGGVRQSLTTPTSDLGEDMPRRSKVQPDMSIESITATQLRALLESQQYKCALTGMDLTPETASLDHKIPVGRGGPHEIGNLWILHHNVNAAKGTMTPEEFVDLCRKVAAHNT